MVLLVEFSNIVQFAHSVAENIATNTTHIALQLEWLQGFFNPKKRLYWGYLACALGIALLWLTTLHRHSFQRAWQHIFQRKVWLGASARADYLSMVVNGVLLGFIAPKLLTKTIVATALFTWLHDVFQGRPHIVSLAAWQVSALFTLFLFVLDDFARYWLHRLMHTIPALWAFHKVHHTATSLNPLTIYRTHPVESVLFILRSALVQGISIGLFVFLFGEQVSLLQVLGANICSFAFNALGANLRHSPITIAYWRPVEKILISPAQHHIHHSISPQHYDKNFGVALAVWDWMFGSLHHGKSMQTLEYGVVETSKENTKATSPHTLIGLYLRPFIECCSALRKLFPHPAK